jgi:hypothetical protein
LRRIFGQRSEEMLKLAGSTIRNVSRGVVGIALVQSFLAGLGFLAAGIPAAGLPELHRPRLGDHSDRAGNSVRTDRRVELDRNGDVERPHVYRLHGPGRPGGQRSQAPRHGPRIDHPDAGNLHRRRRRYTGIRNQRPVPLAKVAFKRRPAFESCGPTHEMKAAADVNLAGQIAPWSGRLMRSILPNRPSHLHRRCWDRARLRPSPLLYNSHPFRERMLNILRPPKQPFQPNARPQLLSGGSS